MYTCHFGVYRKQLVDDLGGFRPAFDGSQDYDLVLRVSEKTNQIYHIPKMLYHWRMIKGSASVPGEKPYAYVAAKKALSEHLQRRRIDGQIMDGNWPGYYKIRFKVPHTQKISIVISRYSNIDSLRACLSSVKEKTSYGNYEIVVVARQGLDGDLAQYLSSQWAKVVFCQGPLSPSRLINFGVQNATGEYLLLQDGDTEVISADWITSLLGYCQQEEIGAIGAKLIDRSNRILHAGLILGLKGVVGYPLWKLPRDSHQNNNFSCSTRNCSAVSSACMMVRKSVFDAVGGFDQTLSTPYNEVDFCLKMRKAGYRIVWTPFVELYYAHKEQSLKRHNSTEATRLADRWGTILAEDPYYNKNLTLRHEDFGYRI
jgi:GT2 family glycosyltransferase